MSLASSQDVKKVYETKLCEVVAERDSDVSEARFQRMEAIELWSARHVTVRIPRPR